MTKISIIVATDTKGAIGINNDLLCYLPNDLKHFKATTNGYPILMGRKTFESLPKGALPNRRNIVITRDGSLQFDGCEMCGSIDAALQLCQSEEQIFIIGGGSIYKEAIDFADSLYVTYIAHEFVGADTFFPEIDASVWKEITRQNHKADDKHAYDYSFVTLAKIKR